MSVPNDQLQAGIKVLERIKTNFQWQVSQLKVANVARPKTSRAAGATIPEENPSSGNIVNFELKPGELPCLEQLIASYEKITSPTILLGSCEDGVPLQIELKNPAPGSILIAGDPGCGKTRLLRSILASAALLNLPDEVSICIIASNADEYTDLAEEVHCQSLLTTSEPGAARLVKELSQELDNRQAGHTGLAMILAIDDLASFSARIGREAFGHLIRLIKHGPRSQIWPIAALSIKDINRVDQQLLEAFRTHLIGHISDTRVASYLSRDPYGDSSSLSSGKQFSVPVSGAWMNFWICDPCQAERSPKEENDGNRNVVV